MFGQRLLNRVLNRTLDKAEDKVEDLLVEKASEAIARKIYASMSDAFDKMLLDAMKNDSTFRATGSDSLSAQYSDMARTWMERLNESANVPKAYHFDHILHTTSTHDEHVTRNKLYLSSQDPVFALEEKEQSSMRLMVIDAGNDVTVLYMEDEKGHKTAQAIPNMMAMGMAIAKTQKDEEAQENWSFAATGKEKNVAGYNTREYSGTDGKVESLIYITDELDISWGKSIAVMLEKFSGTSTTEMTSMKNGFMLDCQTFDKKKSKKNMSRWVTEKVEVRSFVVTNADYEFGALEAE